MKRLFFLVFLVAAAVTGFAQQTAVNPSQINPSQIDFSMVDLSQTKFFFEGPAEFYVTGIRYNGTVYSAILDYNGGGSFSVRSPRIVTTAGKPQSIDLSNITMQVAPDGIWLHNNGVDGASFSGKLIVTPQNELVISDYAQTGFVATPVSALQDRVSTLQSSVDSLQSDIGAKDNIIRALDRAVLRLQEKTSSQSQTISSLLVQVVAKDETISTLRNQASSQSEMISGLRLQLQTAGRQAPAPSPADYPILLASGFAGGSGRLGVWRMVGDNLEQQNGTVLYAKYIAQIPQSRTQYYAQFSAHTSASGWSGYGAHILATGSKTANGYGFGSSYLIWVTYDPVHLQTAQTFVQLYRSYDDAHMVQLVSRAIASPIDRDNTIGVAVDRANNSIAVMANGKELFVYGPTEPIDSGDTIALRALGAVTFTSAQMRTK